MVSFLKYATKKSLSLFCVLMSGLFLLSCHEYSSKEKSSDFDSLDARYSQLINNYLVERDTFSLNEAERILNKIITERPTFFLALASKAQILVWRKEYDEAKKLVAEKELGKFLISEWLFPNYTECVVLQIDVLKANAEGNTEKVKELIQEMEAILRKDVFSPRFNIEDFCRNNTCDRQDIIIKDIIFQKWCQTIAYLNGNEGVKDEINKIKSTYNLSVELMDYERHDFSHDILKQRIFP